MSDDGKCGGLPADARILRADNGSEIAVGKLFQTGERPLVWSLDQRNRLTAGPMTSVEHRGRAEVFTLRLASGRTMEAAASQQLMTLGGWKPLDELAIDDRIAVPRSVRPPQDIQRMADDELILLAHMIGDGSCVKRQPIRYASVDEQNLRAVTKAALRFGVTAVRDEYPAARVTTLRLPAPYRLARGKRNPIAAWLDGLGLFGLRSYEKFVPAAVFAVPIDQIALFLRHLWATDGCIKWDAKVGQGRIYYASTSKRLVDDVRLLLLRLDISSRAYCIPQGKYRDIWHLHVAGVGNQLRFLQHVDAHGAKFFDAREVFTNLAGVQSNANVDTVPREVWNRVRQGLTEQQVSHRAFAAAMHTKFCGSTMWKHSPSRGRLHRAAGILEDQELHDLTTNDVFWDKVVEITAIGKHDVFELVVADTQNVVVNGMSVRAAAPEGPSTPPTG